MSLPHAIIIAGGRGERLGGVRKADLRFGGKRLIDRVGDSLGPIAGPLLISVGPRDDGRGTRADSMRVTDLSESHEGPLAGLAAGVFALQNHGISEGLLVSVAVDTPFLPADFISRLQNGLGQAPAAFATWGDGFYPPNAIWRIEALADLPNQIRRGTAAKSLKALQQGLGARAVGWDGPANPFSNINTLADIVQLGARARD